MEGLRCAAEDQAYPEEPALAEICFDEASEYGPTADPLTETRTMYATANCWLSGSKISATIPRMTEPPAEMPPRNRPTTMVLKFGASAHGIC